MANGGNTPADFSDFIYSGPGATPDTTTPPPPAPATAQAPPQLLQPESQSPALGTPFPTPSGNQMGSYAPNVSPDQGAGGYTLPQPYQGPALRGGPVKNALTRAFYGMGQAMLAHVGLPTDYDIQKTQYNQAIQANDLALKWQQAQRIPVTMNDGTTYYLPPAAAKGVLAAREAGGWRFSAQQAKRMMVPGRGIYDPTLYNQDTGAFGAFVPGTENGAQVDDALIADYPWLARQKGQWLTANQLMRAQSQRLQEAGTTRTTWDPVLQATTVTHTYKNLPSMGAPGAAAPSGATVGPAPTDQSGLPAIPQPIQPVMLPPTDQQGRTLFTPQEAQKMQQWGIQVPQSAIAAPTPQASAQTPPAAAPARPAAPPAPPPGGPRPTTPPTAPTTTAAPTAGVIPPAPADIPGPIWTTAVQLVQGNGNPNALSRGKYGFALANAADRYSIQTTGKPFDQAQAVINFNYANQPQTQNTLKFLNSLTGADNKSGNLQALINLSDSPALARTEWPKINDVQAWMRLQSGSGPQAAYAALALETADQVGKILAGGQQGTSDKKLNDAQALFQKGFTTQQMRDVASTLRTALGNRKNEMIANNPYLQRMYGQPGAGAGGSWGAQWGLKPQPK